MRRHLQPGLTPDRLGNLNKARLSLDAGGLVILYAYRARPDLFVGTPAEPVRLELVEHWLRQLPFEELDLRPPEPKVFEQPRSVRSDQSVRRTRG